MPIELDKDGCVVVAGAGGFIGGHLVTRLLEDGHRKIRAVDNKPIGQWYQRPAGVDYVQADLRRLESCLQVVDGARTSSTLLRTWGAWGSLSTTKPIACFQF